ncbi:MAG: ThuA domain-containing protein [Fimbriimonadaceae bacterium]
MPRTLILVDGFDHFHDLAGAADSLRQILAAGWIPVQTAWGLSRFAERGRVVAEAEVAVLVLTGASLAASDLEDFRNRVLSGLGVVAVHAANVPAGDLAPGGRGEGLLEIVGSRFTGHAAFGRLRVETVARHPITEGLGPFDIDDEPYEFEWTGPEPEVLAVRRTSDGGAYPSVYARNHGEGRVAYIGLGHDARSWTHPSFRRLFERSVRWAGREL